MCVVRLPFDRVLSVVLTAAAVAMAIAVVRREFAPSSVSGLTRQPVFHDGWRAMLTAGIEMGPSSAPIKIVEFTDLECPACRVYHRSVLPEVLASFGDRVSPVFLHLPLQGHRFARPAAVAAECAARENAFNSFIFAKQDSVGLKPWHSFAREAGIRDSIQFASCIGEPSAVPRIDAGLALADSLGVRGTPTIIVNGWMFSAPPSARELTRVVDALLHGRHPFPFVAQRSSGG